jgi:MoaA/NifB/PqqE/SkfB family radical SAM enzyme
MNNRQILGVADYAAWLPAADGSAGGWICVAGWVRRQADEKPAQVWVITEEGAAGQCYGPVASAEPRPDLAGAHDVSPDCGFDIHLPRALPPDRAANVYLFIVRDGSAATHRIALTDFGRPAELAAARGLNRLAAAKLANLFLNEAERLGRTATKKSKPISLYIDPSFACHLECPHCISNGLRIAGVKRPILKDGLLDRILARYGETLIRVTFALWGEPLLNKNFPAHVRKLKQHGIFVEFSTTLSVPMSDAQIEDLVGCGVDAFRISIDGVTQPVYERYRVGGRLDLALGNLRRLAAARGSRAAPYMSWQFLQWPWNLHELDEARRMAAEIGVGFSTFPGDPWTIAMNPRAREAGDAALPIAPDWAAAAARARDERRAGRRHVGCDFLDHSLAINSDGVMHPCCYVVEPKDAVGSWDGEADPFNAPAVTQLRKFVRDLDAPLPVGPSPCVTCGPLKSGHVPDQLGFAPALGLLLPPAPPRR